MIYATIYLVIGTLWAIYASNQQSKYSLESTWLKYLAVFYLNMLLWPFTFIVAIKKGKIFKRKS